MRPLNLVLLAAVSPLVVACQTSDRMASNPFSTSERMEPAFRQPAAPPRIETAPAARVDTSPLDPPPGAELAAPADPQIGADGTTPAIPEPAPQTPQQTARVEPQRAPDPEPAAPTRNSVTGNWNVREASGSCRITLSSSPRLDLYGASTSGCQSRDLQRVTAWELRGEEVYLYEPGGGVAARLKAKGRSMDGTIAKTGAPIGLSK